ncbi:MAG: hypothetical protein GEU88_09910 [Solirubrobacterales bacterium]|nr:hypothetical protein [Solirubrobacterales bacterium]
MQMVLHTTRYGLRAFTRNRRARVFTMFMPLLLLVVFATMFNDANTTVDGITQSYSRYFVASILTLSITSATFAALVGMIVSQRELGVYKRRRATPLSPAALITSQTLTVVLMGVATSVVLLVVAELAFGIHPPVAGVPALIAAVVFGSAAFCGLAFAASTFIDSSDSTQPVIQATMLPLFLISGVWISSADLPSWLNQVAAVFPIEHVADLLHRAFASGALAAGPVAVDLAVLAAWAVVGIVIAVRRFDWLPSGHA